MIPLIFVVCEKEIEVENKKIRNNHDLKKVVSREGLHKWQFTGLIIDNSLAVKAKIRRRWEDKKGEVRFFKLFIVD